jgi:hypothetical protein
MSGQFGGIQINGIVVGDTIVKAGPHGIEFLFNEIAFDKLFPSSQNLCAQSLTAGPQVLSTFLSRARDRLPAGFGFHSETSIVISSNCNARAEILDVRGGDIRITVKNIGNELRVRLTTPDGIPGDLDPKFTIRFDTEADVLITVPKDTLGEFSINTQPIVVANAIQISGANVTGEAVIILRNIIEFITGIDFLSELTREQVLTPNISPDPLAIINSVIDQSGFKGKPIKQGFNAADNTLRFDLGTSA